MHTLQSVSKACEAFIDHVDNHEHCMVEVGNLALYVVHDGVHRFPEEV